MSGSAEGLAALLALLIPAQADVLLAGLGEPACAGVRERVAALLAAPREERLAALAEASAPPAPAARAARASEIAAGERPRLAALVLAMGGGARLPGCAPILARLIQARLSA